MQTEILFAKQNSRNSVNKNHKWIQYSHHFENADMAISNSLSGTNNTKSNK